MFNRPAPPWLREPHLTILCPSRPRLGTSSGCSPIAGYSLPLGGVPSAHFRAPGLALAVAAVTFVTPNKCLLVVWCSWVAAITKYLLQLKSTEHFCSLVDAFAWYGETDVWGFERYDTISWHQRHNTRVGFGWWSQPKQSDDLLSVVLGFWRNRIFLTDAHDLGIVCGSSMT